MSMTGVTTRPFTFDVCAKDSAKTSVLCQRDPWISNKDSGRQNKAVAGKVQSARKPDTTCISCQDFQKTYHIDSPSICAAPSVDQLCTKGVSCLNLVELLVLEPSFAILFIAEPALAGSSLCDVDLFVAPAGVHRGGWHGPMAVQAKKGRQCNFQVFGFRFQI